ncbi:DUF4876 domain-containing protein [Gemmatimonas groenlandica]|uniref:DUF4876 domain-containing protein n=1 Tax=Gemmatimonas groenlandica TaxID=2732249 RepID=A0A6M4II28_9BACT|nr:DUF4876 domain-containing protein [Gemmatimonas groenlandica]QJR34270.1 DUF4876 domain-containing protein [Gemmatimonas groenlandica]
MMRCMRDALTNAAICLAFGVTACGGGTVVDTGTGPGATPTDTTRQPTVQRASIAARVTIDPADAAIAQQAGITVGGLTAKLTRSAAGFTPVTAVTAADGTVRFDNLFEGRYQLSIERTLSSTELQRLTPGDREASLFAGGVDAVLSPPGNASVEVPLVSARRGSLIISELWPFQAPASASFGYGFGTYIEVYNNSDTTVYLDGVTIANTPLALHGGWPEYPCAQNNLAARMDSVYLRLSNLGNEFPGTGRDFPLPPGEGRVVAMDAIDHNAAAPGMEQLDLSRADFENIGSDADTDNPFAVNMVRRTSSLGPFGRGTLYNTSNIAYVLLRAGASAVIDTVVITQTYGTPPAVGSPMKVPRVPREYVLDLASFNSDPTTPGYANVSGITCSPFMAASFDRAPAPLFNTSKSVAISRRSLGRTAAGKEILQRTRTSVRDFEQGPPLLRTLRK